MRLKEKGCFLTNTLIHTIKSGFVSRKADRYYVSILVEKQEQGKSQLNNCGIGTDLGIKDFAVY